MSISGIGYHNYPDNTTANKYHKNKAGSCSYTKDTQGQRNLQSTDFYTSVQDTQKAIYSVRDVEREKEEKQEKQNKPDSDKTDTEIIVKPDGSKIMMTTVWIGGTQTVMSMEIAKPTGILERDTGRNVDNPNMMVSDTSQTIEDASEK